MPDGASIQNAGGRSRHVAGVTVKGIDYAGTTPAHSSYSSNEECRAIALVDVKFKVFRRPTLHSWRRISRQDNVCLPRQCDIPLVNGMKTQKHQAHKRHDDVLDNTIQFPIKLLSFDCLVHCSVIHFAAIHPSVEHCHSLSPFYDLLINYYQNEGFQRGYPHRHPRCLGAGAGPGAGPGRRQASIRFAVRTPHRTRP